MEKLAASRQKERLMEGRATSSSRDQPTPTRTTTMTPIRPHACRARISTLVIALILTASSSRALEQVQTPEDSRGPAMRERLQSAYLLRARADSPNKQHRRPSLEDHFAEVLDLLETASSRSLDLALRRLEEAQGGHWDAEQHDSWHRQLAAERERNLSVLREYQDRGRFPLNEHDPAQSIPIFVDRHDTACAVGHLMRRSGAEDAVAAIAKSDNFVYVPDVRDGPLVDWILTSGLTQEEAALIQPGYPPPFADTNLGRLSEEPYENGNLRFSELRMSLAPDPADPGALVVANAEDVLFGAGPDLMGREVADSERLRELVSRAANLGAGWLPPWLSSKGSGATGHQVVCEFQVATNGYEAITGFGIALPLNWTAFNATRDGGRILVRASVYDSSDNALGTAVLDSDEGERLVDPDGVASETVAIAPVATGPLPPRSALRVVAEVTLWGDSALWGIQFGFTPVSPTFTHRVVESEVEITGYVRGLSAEVVIPEEIGGMPVTAIADGAFSGLAEMTSIALPNTITSIGHGAFSGCRGLTAIRIPGGVVALGEGAFAGCEQLAEVLLPPGLASIGEHTFARCHGLQTIDLPAATAVIGPRAFLGCSGLRSLTLPDGVRSIGAEAFAQCQALETVTLPGSVEEIAYAAFADCESLAAIEMESANPVFRSMQGCLYDSAGETLLQVPGGRAGTLTVPAGVSRLDSHSLRGCRKLTRV